MFVVIAGAVCVWHSSHDNTLIQLFGQPAQHICYRWYHGRKRWPQLFKFGNSYPNLSWLQHKFYGWCTVTLQVGRLSVNLTPSTAHCFLHTHSTQQISSSLNYKRPAIGSRYVHKLLLCTKHRLSLHANPEFIGLEFDFCKEKMFPCSCRLSQGWLVAVLLVSTVWWAWCQIRALSKNSWSLSSMKYTHSNKHMIDYSTGALIEI